MNAPHLCKLRKIILLALAMAQFGVNKTPPFLHFPIANGGRKTIAHFQIAEKLSF
jgi:hypothetical protein